MKALIAASEFSSKKFDDFLIELNDSIISTRFIFIIAAGLEEDDDSKEFNKIAESYKELIDSLIRPLLIEKGVLLENQDVLINECLPTKQQLYSEGVILVFDVFISWVL